MCYSFCINEKTALSIETDKRKATASRRPSSRHLLTVSTKTNSIISLKKNTKKEINHNHIHSWYAEQSCQNNNKQQRTIPHAKKGGNGTLADMTRKRR